MAKRLNPYAIRHPNGTFFSQMYVQETKVVTLNKIVVGHEDTHRPEFKATDETTATQFHTEQDALDLINNPDFGGPESFAGCTVVPVWE